MSGDEDGIRSLIREIEVEKGRLSIHEAECVLRYGRIEEKQDAVKDAVEEVSKALVLLTGRLQGTAWKMNWKAWAAALSLISMLVGALAWTGGQLYGVHPYRAPAAQVAPR